MGSSSKSVFEKYKGALSYLASLIENEDVKNQAIMDSAILKYKRSEKEFFYRLKQVIRLNYSMNPKNYQSTRDGVWLSPGLDELNFIIDFISPVKINKLDYTLSIGVICGDGDKKPPAYSSILRVGSCNINPKILDLPIEIVQSHFIIQNMASCYPIPSNIALPTFGNTMLGPMIHSPLGKSMYNPSTAKRLRIEENMVPTVNVWSGDLHKKAEIVYQALSKQ